MSPTKPIHETQRELYLQILKKAQKESDHVLVKLIAKKLATPLDAPHLTTDGCQVIAFPDLHASGLAAGPDGLDWKNGRVWRNLFLIMASFGFFTSWFLFFCQHFLPLKNW